MPRYFTYVAAVLAALTVPISGTASNFGYSHLQVDFSFLGLDEPIDVGSYEIQYFPGARIGGGYQFTDFFAVTLDSGAYTVTLDEDDIDLTLTRGRLSADFPIAAGERVDLVPSLGYMLYEVEACSGATCVSTETDGSYYGLGARAWIYPEVAEFSAFYNNSTNPDFEAEFNPGLRFHIGNHALQLDAVLSDADIVSWGYRYTW